MPIRQLAARTGILDEDDIGFLQSIFNEVCALNDVQDDLGKDALSRKLLVLFQGGTRDRELLLAALAMGRVTRRGRGRPPL